MGHRFRGNPWGVKEICQRQESRPEWMDDGILSLITKIISKQINLVLGIGISPKQFGFLASRQILDAISLAQEVLHSVKLKKL